MNEKPTRGIPILEFDNFCKHAAHMVSRDYREMIREKEIAQKKADKDALLNEAKTAMRDRIIAYLKKHRFVGTDQEASEFADRQIKGQKFYCSNDEIVSTTGLCSTTKYYISNDANKKREDPFEALKIDS